MFHCPTVNNTFFISRRSGKCFPFFTRCILKLCLLGEFRRGMKLARAEISIKNRKEKINNFDVFRVLSQQRRVVAYYPRYRLDLDTNRIFGTSRAAAIIEKLYIYLYTSTVKY